MLDRSCVRSEALESLQWDKLRGLLDLTLRNNAFYRDRWSSLPTREYLGSIDGFKSTIPWTTKAELSSNQLAFPPFGSALNFPLQAYSRCHQTSGTTGSPLRWLDTPESWEAMTRHWMWILQSAGVTASDRILFAFSFGPFLGFWLAFDSANRLGSLCFPAGGLSTSARARQILELGITAVCCTPSYALRLAEVVREDKLELAQSKLTKWIVAGESGGSVPEVRARIEQAWPGSAVYDHHGMTETGPVTYQCPKVPGLLHVMESGFLAEIVNPVSGAPVSQGESGELVLTTLDRVGSPLFRYRTGDLVRPVARRQCECGTVELGFEGGILGRCDDMVVVRGVNVYPVALESLIRSGGPVLEFRVRVARHRALSEISIDVEFDADESASKEHARALAKKLETSLALRVPVTAQPRGTLPRFEMKARRWIHQESI